MECFGVYGISGVGKTTLCKKIVSINNNFEFFDGSSVIKKELSCSGLKFGNLSTKDKYEMRLKIHNEILKSSKEKNKKILVCGHYSFLEHTSFDIAWIDKERTLYKKVFYIYMQIKDIIIFHNNDNIRKRKYTMYTLKKWIEFDYNSIKKECEVYNIPFYTITEKDIDIRSKLLLGNIL